jgi:hypothetical protein
MMAEYKQLIIFSWRTFIMGHTGDIEAIYTLNKGLPPTLLNEMRVAYEKSAERFLVANPRRENLSEEELEEIFNRRFLIPDLAEWQSKELKT